MNFPYLRRYALVGICLSISACGFSLRSNEALAGKFSELPLELDQPNSEFSQLLRQNPDIASVRTATTNDTSAQATLPVLRVSNERMVSRPLSVTPRARAAQYELRLSIDATLTQGTELLMGPETLRVERSYFEDIENSAGNQEEREIIDREMRRELTNQLLRRLEAADKQN